MSAADSTTAAVDMKAVLEVIKRSDSSAQHHTVQLQQFGTRTIAVHDPVPAAVAAKKLQDWGSYHSHTHSDMRGFGQVFTALEPTVSSIRLWHWYDHEMD